jgi:hypothetical protein
MPQDTPLRQRYQIATGYKPKFATGGHVKKSAGTDKFQFQKYGNGVRKIKK